MTPIPKPKKKPKKSKAIPKWMVLEVFERDNYTCQFCQRTFPPGGPLHCHHVIFQSQGGRTEMSNLETACFECHRKIHDHHIPNIPQRSKYQEYEAHKAYLKNDGLSPDEYQEAVTLLAERLGI